MLTVMYRARGVYCTVTRGGDGCGGGPGGGEIHNSAERKSSAAGPRLGGNLSEAQVLFARSTSAALHYLFWIFTVRTASTAGVRA